MIHHHGQQKASPNIGLRFERSLFDLMVDHGFFPVLEPKDWHQKLDEKRNGIQEPDLMFEYKGVQFWVDCIYGTNFKGNQLELYFKEECLSREKAYVELSGPLFIAVGVSGTPEEPDTFLFDYYVYSNIHNISRDQYGRVTTHFNGEFIEHKSVRHLRKRIFYE
ncbi:hypothetical protein Mpt1_c03250 [Candidatus Methanoplasma termitum]|uniref:Uncharacterized protein n=2 Tax=Candidatus Methanoplasma termitum TaxID=1577791 RepID=A0A0A7LB46_9ARCH|nr:hypothetical protein Mpt1_c03250 [Candidatus Methanoplasma termitum]